MKVLFLNVFFPPQSIGGATFICADLTDFFFNNPSLKVEPVVLTTDLYVRSGTPVLVDSTQGYRCYRVPTPLSDDELSFPGMASIVEQVIEAEQVDLVAVHAVQRFGLEMFEVFETMGVPFVVTMHDGWWLRDHMFFMEVSGLASSADFDDVVGWWQLNERQTESPTQGPSTRAKATRSVLSKAAKVVVVSQAFADIMISHGLENFKVIENGIPRPTVQTEKSVHERWRVAFLAGEAEHKGFKIFREAVEELDFFKGKVLVSSEHLPPGVRIMELWGNTLVTRLGPLSRESIYRVLVDVDVLFVPSIIPESFGMLAREAILAGCTVVTTGEGGLAELLGHPQVQLIDKSSAAILEALIKLDLGAPDSPRRTTGSACNIEIRDTEMMAMDYLSLFREFVSVAEVTNELGSATGRE